MSTEPIEPIDAEAEAARAAEADTGAPFPAFTYLQGVARRATDEEQVEIDRAVSWLFMATAAGTMLREALEGADDEVQLQLLQRLAESDELDGMAGRLTGPFALLARERLLREEVDVVMTAAQGALPNLFAALEELKGEGAASGAEAGEVEAGDVETAAHAAAQGAALSPATMAIFQAIALADPRHLHDLAVVIGAFAEAYTLAAKRAKERGKPLDLTGAVTRSVPHFPKTAPEMAAALLPAIAAALGELPAEEWTVTTGRRGQA